MIQEEFLGKLLSTDLHFSGADLLGRMEALPTACLRELPGGPAETATYEVLFGKSMVT